LTYHLAIKRYSNIKNNSMALPEEVKKTIADAEAHGFDKLNL
jgi:uncharacterized protein (UPF0335 family)